MADITVKSLDEFEAVFGGGFRRVRSGLGVSSFGIAVMELPAQFSGYPVHSQTHDSQEEVYTVLEGRAILIAGDERHEMVPGVFARVGPTEVRQFVTEAEPARLLAIGGVPGGVYAAPDFTEEGAPAPGLDKHA